jgi:hypothetical protein
MRGLLVALTLLAAAPAFAQDAAETPARRRYTYPVRYGEAAELARLLDALFAEPGARGDRPDARADERANELEITATEEELARILALLAPHPAPREALRLVQLANLYAAELAPLLAGLAAGGGRVIADARTNSLLIIAEGDALELLAAAAITLDAARLPTP